jgi:glycosyltransferase involved in cell wall biosynthesis
MPSSTATFQQIEQPLRSYGTGSLQKADELHVERLRVALLTNEIPPYCVPYYQELASTSNWDLKVLTCTDRETDRLWQVEKQLSFASKRCFSFSYHRTTRHQNRVTFKDRRQVHLPLGMLWDLYRFNPDVILSGELGARTLIGALYARLRNRPLVVSFEGTPHTERNIKWSQRLLRRAIGQIPHAYLVMGNQGQEYVQQLGVPPSAIFKIGQYIDLKSFADRPSDTCRDVLRSKFGIQGQCFLYCGRLVSAKGVHLLLNAWKEFSRSDGIHATLILAGEGDEKPRLQQYAAENGLSNVSFLGHVAREQLPEIYQAADIFVFPTLIDCWGLVVNEALASGLPVILSQYAGSSELISEGRNGWVTDPLNQADLLQKLRSAWEARQQHEVMSASARQSVASLDVPVVAARVRKAVASVLRKRGIAPQEAPR